MERHPLSSRLHLIVAIRRARALADLGDDAAFRLIQRAQVHATDSIQPNDPTWTWWADEREVLVHQGGMWRTAGRPDRAVDCYIRSLDAAPASYPWASYIGTANLTAALVETRSWHEAEHAAEHIATLSSDVSSARAQRRLHDAAGTARQLRAPTSLDDMLTQLAHT